MKITNKEMLNLLDLDIFKLISSASEELNLETFIVGGFVRDLILNNKLNKDIDIMCVGSGIDLAKAFHNKIKPSSPLVIKLSVVGEKAIVLISPL